MSINRITRALFYLNYYPTKHSPLLRTLNSNLHTNAERIKKEDPYATLGLTWGATTTEIKQAYKKLARQYHPDLNKTEKALVKFQKIQIAYDKLMNNGGDLNEEWSFNVWRGGDIIAQKREDVAGLKRKRPVKPASSGNWGTLSIGHPSGTGSFVRGEYIGDGKKSSSVGTGRNKWVKPKEFKPWNPEKKV